MQKRYPLIAAAVAAALGPYVADAQVPTLAQAAAPVASLVIAGSSAAGPGVETAVERDLCGGSGNFPGAGTTLAISSNGGSTNFLAYSCTTTRVVGGIASGSVITVYYRAEGGSVVGALPVIANTSVKRLLIQSTGTICSTAGTTDFTGASVAHCSVTGATSLVGTSDGWGGSITEDNVQLGITDVEPGQLVYANFPSAYSQTAFGTATPSTMKGLTKTRLFDQVFGLFVNNGTGSNLPATINLSTQSAINILSGAYTDWHAIPDALSGNAISATAKDQITVINREFGSGTRTSASIYFFQYGCPASGSANPLGTATTGLFYATSDELTAANSTPGAIAYASIDNFLNPGSQTKWTNLVLATLDGITPSNAAAAAGQYGWWYEATAVTPTPNTVTTGTSLDLSNALISDLQTKTFAPPFPDIMAIPGVGGNSASLPVSSNNNGLSGTYEIYVNPFSRGGASCNAPALQTTQN
jgi:hypothetical protein